MITFVFMFLEVLIYDLGSRHQVLLLAGPAWRFFELLRYSVATTRALSDHRFLERIACFLYFS